MLGSRLARPNNPNRGSDPKARMLYRKEIDGLRALAVLPVILFHAGIPAFGGGFVGVDVFFVISGYLITSIILAEKQEGTFTLSGFYERRARRILPALFAVMAICVAVAWFYFLPDQMKTFGQGISASAAFSANIYSYLKGDDYFGLQSEANPILHLWSLALEEQYYLIFPLAVMAGWQFGRRALLAFVAVVALISLAAAHWGSTRFPVATFYLLPARAWELLAGSLIAFLLAERCELPSTPALRESLGLAGLALIVVAVFTFDRSTPFPSLYALVPTIGAVLIILFASQGTIAGKLLGSRLPVGIGLISFSAYLWHQPLFAFYRLLATHEPEKTTLLGLSLASLVLAYLTWRFVEKPFRVKGRFSRKAVLSTSAAVSVAFVLFGVAGHYNSGFPSRDPLFSRLASNFGLSLSCNGNFSINATCATSNRPKVAIYGNSYAMHLVEGFRAAFPDASFVQITQDSCAPHAGDQRHRAGKLSCPDFHASAMATILETPSIRTVVISATFGDLVHRANAAAFEETVAKLVNHGKSVVIVGPTPSTNVDFAQCLLRSARRGKLGGCDFERSQVSPVHFRVVDQLREIAQSHGGAFHDLTDIICNGIHCRTSIDDIIVYRDSGHLSREGSRLVFGMLGPELAKNLAK